MTIPETNAASAWGSTVWTWAAWAVSLAALSGSLLLSLALSLNACPLCLYQRTFIMGVVAVLGIGISVRGWRPGLISLLALPLAAASLGIVIFHEYQYQAGNLECPRGISRWLTAPQESLAVHGLLILFLLVDVLRTWQGYSLPAVVSAMLLGGVFSVAALMTVPKGPAEYPNYKKPVDEDGCRKPKQQ